MRDETRTWRQATKMNVTLRQLRVFMEVARLASFSRAGQKIGLTQSAVSRSIRELEDELGLKLLDRTTREVVLTDAGMNLVASVSRLLGELDGALREIREIGEQRRGRVVVAAAPTVSARVMPLAVAECNLRHRYIALSLRDEVQNDVLRKVKTGEVDFGVVIAPVLDPMAADGLLLEPVMTDSFSVVCRDDHALAQRDEVGWGALQGERLVLLDHASGSRPLIEKVFHDHGIEPEIVQEMAHPASVFGLVDARVGISVMPDLALPPPAGLALVSRPLVPTAERTVALVRRRDRSLSPAADAVWQIVREVPLKLGPSN
ncbi:HTH-type transcriptional regulator CynR [Pararobbsia alpina]|uniref:HTH-type transcriptional regulator CynR n=2 Tax=Pararobbsia alpina TaxID=621374 RepID=A0A6S7B1N9_9BURK|nr:HTH-type transcriptional regulator CynR [Pararobbsia alpina]